MTATAFDRATISERGHLIGPLARAMTGAAMLASVFVVHVSPLRIAGTIGGVILLGRASGQVAQPAPTPRPCRSCGDLLDGLAEVEAALMRHQAWTMDRAEDIAVRVERITLMVADLGDQVR